MLTTLLFTVIILVISVVLLSIKVLLKKGGRFPNTHIEGNKAAKKAFDDLGVKKLPTVKSLQEEYAKLLAEKKAAYAEYRRSRDEMRELLLHKQNVDRMLGKDERSEEKKQEHDRQ